MIGSRQREKIYNETIGIRSGQRTTADRRYPIPSSTPGVSTDPINTTNSITAEAYKPLQESFQNLQRQKIPEYRPIAPQFANQAPVPLLRPEPEFYQNLFNQKLMPVQQQFFNPGGISDQAIADANRRGFFTGGPSGVASQLFSQTVTDPYAQALANTQNQVNIIRGETETRLAQVDAERIDSYRDFMSNLIGLDSNNEEKRVIAQQNIDNSIIGLETAIAQGLAAGSTSEEFERAKNMLAAYEISTNAGLEMSKINNQNQQFYAGLDQQDTESLRDFWIRSENTPGGTGTAVPYEDLGAPRPYGINGQPGNYVGQVVRGEDGYNYTWNGQQWDKHGFK